MEFLVDMVTTVPPGTSDADVAAIRAREAAHSTELASEGHLLRLWRPPLAPGGVANLGPVQCRRRRSVGAGSGVDAVASVAQGHRHAVVAAPERPGPGRRR